MILSRKASSSKHLNCLSEKLPHTEVSAFSAPMVLAVIHRAAIRTYSFRMFPDKIRLPIQIPWLARRSAGKMEIVRQTAAQPIVDR